MTEDEAFAEYVRRTRQRKPTPKLAVIAGGLPADRAASKPTCELKCVEGSRDEQLWRRLLADPASFSMAEFELLTEVTFRDRLDHRQEWALMGRRLEAEYARSPSLEGEALLAMVNGDIETFQKLMGSLPRRSEAKLRVVGADEAGQAD